MLQLNLITLLRGTAAVSCNFISDMPERVLLLRIGGATPEKLISLANVVALLQGATAFVFTGCGFTFRKLC